MFNQEKVVIILIIDVILIIYTGTRNWWRLALVKGPLTLMTYRAMFDNQEKIVPIVIIVIVILIIYTGTRNCWRLAPAKDYWFVSSYSG